MSLLSKLMSINLLGLSCQVTVLCLASCRLTRSIRKAPADAVRPVSGVHLYHTRILSAWAVRLVSQSSSSEGGMQ